MSQFLPAIGHSRRCHNDGYSLSAYLRGFRFTLQRSRSQPSCMSTAYACFVSTYVTTGLQPKRAGSSLVYVVNMSAAWGTKIILKPFTSNTSCLLCMRLHVSALTGPSSGPLTNQVGNAAYMLGSQLCLQLFRSKILLKPLTSNTYIYCV
jgi:hypothetical protein